jgi:type II secretory pathway component GspD/PulD (secretin)
MNKSTYFKILLGCAVIMVFVWQAWAQSEPDQEEQMSDRDIGRFDPFERVSRQEKTSVLQGVFQQGRPADTVPELCAKSVIIKFLRAKNLEKALENMVTEYGSISTDKESNSLIICDTKENLERIMDEIRNADKTPQQIMVEVVILDVKLDDDVKIGIDWNVVFDDRYAATYDQTVASTWAVGDIFSSATFAITTGNIASIVYALQEKKDVEILASPKIMVVSGQTSCIQAIEEIPYQENSQSSESQTVLTYTEFKNVGIKLTVGATLTDDNDILLVVDTEQNVQTGTSSGVPVVDTRKANTSLLLRDSEVVVMGGLRRQEQTIDVEQIPLLSDLPIIGGLFRGTNTITKNSELVVFLSPHVYREKPLSSDELEKFNQLRNRALLRLPID